MGHIYTEAKFSGVRGKKKVKVLVDTGATYTVISPEFSEEIGVLKLPRKLKLADNRETEAEAGSAILEVNGREIPITVVILPGSEILLGIEALEALGLKPNPETGELEPTRTYTIRA